jgi:hypothetical protein
MDISSTISSSYSTQNLSQNKTKQAAADPLFALLVEDSNKAEKTSASASANAATSLTEAPKEKPDAAQEFLDYMKLTPAQRMQYAWLEQHGISKEQFDSMSAEDQQKLLDQMKHDIEDKIKQGMQDKPKYNPVNMLV